MTDMEKLLIVERKIQKMEAMLYPLYDEKRYLVRKIKKDTYNSFPFPNPTKGYWFEGKTSRLYLYVNETDKTLYRKPLYKANGFLFGKGVTRVFILNKQKEYLKNGYRIVE